jgi:hypothetical protein
MRKLHVLQLYRRAVMTNMGRQRGLSLKALYGVAALVAAVLSLMPGITGSYAFADCGGGGGGSVSCFMCTPAGYDEYGQQYHDDFNWFNSNNLHGTFHGMHAPGPCVHASYTQ